MKIAILISSLLTLGISQSAQANLIVNGSFESGNFVPNGDNAMSLSSGSTAMTGWTVIGDSIAWIDTPNSFSLTASSGNFFLDLTDYPVSPPYGGVRQTITTIPFAVYSISFDVGALSGTTQVKVSAGNLSDTGSSSSVSTETWTTFTSFFTAQSASTTIDLSGIQAARDFIGLDNVIVELDHLPNTVPEPSSWTLACWGLLAFLKSIKSRVVG